MSRAKRLMLAAGLRQYTSILSGTPPTGEQTDVLDIVFAGIYLLLYFAFLVGVPILVIAAGLMGLLQRGVTRPDDVGRSPGRQM